MNIFSKIGELLMNIFKTSAEKEFNCDIISSDLMEIAQNEWDSIIKAKPYWTSESVKTINFAKFICYYTSKKVCLDLAVNITGSARADYINDCIKEMVKKSIRDKVEDACGLGGIILKPSGTYESTSAIDYVLPQNFYITEQDSNGNILGIIFSDRKQVGDYYYTRLEYQHFVKDADEKLYMIENKAFKSKDASKLGSKIPLDDLADWKDIAPELIISNIEKPLFGYFKMPYNNTIDYNSPEGVSVFANAIEELKDLDVAWSRKGTETEDSQHITFVDESALLRTNKDGLREKVKLPRFVRGLRRGVEESNTIQEHVPTMLTEQRIADINSILSMISTKCGFSQGQFILDRKTGTVTATQIESDDSETVETIADVRNALKSAVNDLIYALNKYCDVFFDMPDGYVDALDENVSDEDIYYFKDLMASFEQDRTRAYQLMLQGKYSTRKYLKEYEGFSDEEVDEMMREIQEERGNANVGLFDE